MRPMRQPKRLGFVVLCLAALVAVACDESSHDDLSRRFRELNDDSNISWEKERRLIVGSWETDPQGGVVERLTFSPIGSTGEGRCFIEQRSVGGNVTSDRKYKFHYNPLLQVTDRRHLLLGWHDGWGKKEATFILVSLTEESLVVREFWSKRVTEYRRVNGP